MMIDDWWWLMMIDDDWWLMMIDDWWWLMMIDDRWWLMIADDWWLMMIDDDWWLMMIDDDWWLMMILTLNLKRTLKFSNFTPTETDSIRRGSKGVSRGRRPPPFWKEGGQEYLLTPLFLETNLKVYCNLFSSRYFNML